MDHCCDFADSVAIGNGQFLHFGRIYSHPARAGHYHDLDTPDPGKKSGGLRENGQQPVALPAQQGDTPIFAEEDSEMTEHRCGTCDQSFSSGRELQEHQENEHSGKQQSGKPVGFPEPSTGDQAERQKKIV